MFEKVDNVSDLEPILKERLPTSANIFNNCKNHSSWSQDRNWYALGGDTSSHSWIISTINRPDYGLEITASRPADSVVTSEIRAAFSDASFIDWSESYMFPCIDLVIADLITDISARDKGNFTHIYPCDLYYVDIQDGCSLSDKFSHGKETEVKTMKNTQGKDFLFSTWKFSTEGSEKYIETILERNLSAGVYVNGKIESGAVFVSYGLLGMLYTSKRSRGKGYAKSAMHFLMKRCAENGLIPACSVEQRNEISKSFQRKIGFKLAGHTYYVEYEKSGF